ncbi:MAG: hypothetical protein J0H75_15060, partial [Rhizobiales bacterium]|nr:hypothetical protein [Hyphomicrobiales bacterium]
NFFPRDVTRAKCPEVAGREVFECQGHAVDRWRDARLWPLFAAITSPPAAWASILPHVTSDVGACPGRTPDGKSSAQRRLASFGIKQYIASRSKPGTGDIR